MTTGAQYAGYKALPPAPPGSEQQTPEQAAEFVATAAQLDPATYANLILTDARLANWAYQTAAKRLHPDKPEGSQDEFAKLEVSMRIVREQHKPSS